MEERSPMGEVLDDAHVLRDQLGDDEQTGRLRRRSLLLCPVAAPAGPVLERYAGVPWPGGRF